MSTNNPNLQDIKIWPNLIKLNYFYIPGCPSNAFCDYGICRCESGYDARYGSCWNNLENFNQNQEFWSRREQPGFNPYVSCNDHNQCTKEIDMNMICNEKNRYDFT